MTLSAREVRSIFRRNRITIREAAAILNVPMTRVAHLPERNHQSGDCMGVQGVYPETRAGAPADSLINELRQHTRTVTFAPTNTPPTDRGGDAMSATFDPDPPPKGEPMNRTESLMNRFGLTIGDAQRAAAMKPSGLYRCEDCGTVTALPVCIRKHGLTRPLTTEERDQYVRVGHAAFA